MSTNTDIIISNPPSKLNFDTNFLSEFIEQSQSFHRPPHAYTANELIQQLPICKNNFYTIIKKLQAANIITIIKCHHDFYYCFKDLNLQEP